MKKLIYLFLICTAFAAKASTSITTPTVSGHWTMAGSPYLINNNITIAASTSLTIDPGVSVQFSGGYGLIVNGSLVAAGTAALPITFTSTDTSGWWVDTTLTGGWHGIAFEPYSGTGADPSVLDYCNISFTKFDSLDLMAADLNTLFIHRNLSLTHCNFSNNKSFNVGMIYVYSSAPDVFNMGNCVLTDNNFGAQLIFVNNFYGGTDHLYSNSIFQNHASNSLILFGAADVVLDDNNIYNNTSDYGIVVFEETSSLSLIKQCHAAVYSNKIYNNACKFDAAITCYSGKIDIYSNFICNNHHTSGTCGSVDGGGALNLSFNSSAPLDSTAYMVRNNIIANNYSPFHGGGINILNAPAIITNNHIINNKSLDGGAIYVNSFQPLTLKNNLFYGNINEPDVTAINSPVLSGNASSLVTYEHNWSQHSPSFDMDLGTGYLLAGDTTTHVTGADPLMIAPTLTANYSEAALGADFTLYHTSTCIDSGDTASAFVLTTDYAGNPRIAGSAIDIGAYEFRPTTLHNSTVSSSDNSFVVFPNPAKDFINITADTKITSVSISNMPGQTLMRQQINSSILQLGVAELSPGVYMLKLNNDTVVKFIKE